MIHYDIDTTENGYKKFEGNIELLIEPIVLFQIKRLKTCKNRKESLFF